MSSLSDKIVDLSFPSVNPEGVEVLFKKDLKKSIKKLKEEFKEIYNSEDRINKIFGDKLTGE